MKSLVVTLGSAGDLHPLLAVARALADRGDEVEVMSNAPYEAAVRREGLAFSPLVSERDHLRTETHADLWHPIRGFGVLWRHLAVPAIRPVMERVLALRAASEDVQVFASPLAVGARIARDRAAFPLCTLYTAPANLRSTADPMFVGAWRVPHWYPRFARAGMWRLLDWRKLEPMARPAVDGAYRESGLPLVRGSLFGDWIHSPDGGVTLFPPAFCEFQDDWPARTRLGDFPLFRATGDDTLGAEVSRFLEAGEPPVVIFPGSSAGDHGRALLHDALMAARALGLRSLALGSLAVADAQSRESEDAEFVLRLPHAPLDLLLPRAAMFVHHGGIGSTAHGLRARVPQLIKPFAYDQFDNAARVEADGAGRFIPHGPGSRAQFLSAMASLAQSGGAIKAYTEPDGSAAMNNILKEIGAWRSAIR